MARKQPKNMRWLAFPIGLGIAAATAYALLNGSMSVTGTAERSTASLGDKVSRGHRVPDVAARPRALKNTHQIGDESRDRLLEILRAADDSEAN